jgi:hypothetical protein
MNRKRITGCIQNLLGSESYVNQAVQSNAKLIRFCQNFVIYIV